MMDVMVGQAFPTTQTLPVAPDFGQWMLLEQRRIFLLCFRILQDRDEADMAAQDTFLKAYRAIEGGHGDRVEHGARWLTRIAVNTCVDRLRSRAWKFWRRRPAPRDEDLMLALAASPEPSAEARALAGEIKLRLCAALNKLSARQRAVFTLKHYEDRSLDEIGEILGLDLGTVKSHMSRALAKLRTELRDLYRMP